jgi:hypothetical protein
VSDTSRAPVRATDSKSDVPGFDSQPPREDVEAAKLRLVGLVLDACDLIHRLASDRGPR